VRLVSALAAAILAVLSVLPAPVVAAQAASITYEFTPRPAAVPATFVAAPNARVRFLTITAIDGYHVDSALWEPAGKQPATTTMVIAVHGSGADYIDDPMTFLGRGLSAKGYAMLAIDTRQHDEHVNTDNFYDIRNDIQSAVFTARALGYKTIVLLGHSLGTIQVQYYAAQDWSTDIKAVVLLSPFADLPWKSRNLLIADEKQYSDLTAAALKSLHDGTQAAVLPVKMGYLQGASSPVTGQHFLTYRDQTTGITDGTFWIERIPHPVLLVRDQSDGIVLAFEPHMLLAAAGKPGSLVQSVKFVLVPDDRPPSLAGHKFTNNQQPLIDTVTGWLAEQHL
jgi:pimeloyl-ACP methyl ester carboxylesterase